MNNIYLGGVLGDKIKELNKCNWSLFANGIHLKGLKQQNQELELNVL